MPNMDGMESRDWIDIMNHLRDVVKGTIPMEHPGSPQFRPGEKYEYEADDLDFDKRTRASMTANAFRTGLFWGAIPYLCFHIPSMRTSIFRNTRSVLPHALFFGTCGYLKGSFKNANKYAEERFQLNTTIGRESRWKLAEKNPDHPYLRGFETEFNQNARYNNHNHNNHQRRDRHDQHPPQYRGTPPAYQNQANDRKRYDNNYRGGPLSNQDSEEAFEGGFSVDDWFQSGSEGGKIPGEYNNPNNSDYTKQPPNHREDRRTGDNRYGSRTYNDNRNRNENNNNNSNSNNGYRNRSGNYNGYRGGQRQEENLDDFVGLEQVAEEKW